MEPTPSIEAVAAVLRAVEARAAGLWRVARDRLELVAFVPGPELPDEVARDFAEATRLVSLDQTSLGIVQAARGAACVVSRAAELPPHAGSGRWLRAFGAARSVAVPLEDASGAVVAVLSVALDDPPPDDKAIAARLHQELAGWV